MMDDLVALLVIVLLAGIVITALLSAFTVFVIVFALLALLMLPSIIKGFCRAWSAERRAEDSNLSHGDDPSA